MNYKKIIKSKKIRLKILQLLSFLPDKTMTKLQYRISTGKKLNLQEPQTFNEKIQWYKLYYRHPNMMKCVDKYAVREYVAEKGLSGILNECFGVYNTVEEIDFNLLPEKFVMKTTNGCGTNYFCDNISLFDRVSVIKQLKEWMKPIGKSVGREWGYDNIIPRIIIERLLKNEDNPNKEINDYKFLCFNGKVEYIWVDIDRYTQHKRNFYDSQWNYIDVSCDYPNVGNINLKPQNLSKMIEISEKLSGDFPHVRVDLYNINGNIYFGEMTFYSNSGYRRFIPDKFDFILGEKFVLPGKLVIT